jgi:hypothetical protein
MSRLASAATILGGLLVTASAVGGPVQSPQYEACAAAAVSIFKVAARLPSCVNGVCTRGPKRTHYTAPSLDGDVPETCQGARSEHEALIGPDGMVAGVWTTESGCPELDVAASAAIRNWRFMPTIVDGKPTPVCTSAVTVWSGERRGAADERRRTRR